jgi:AcrR family transcriptional regulator
MQSKREHIIDIALMLFYAEGFHATGIERIIKAAGVSKKTLYSYFKSKDELILATLRKRDELFRNRLMRQTEQKAETAPERLLALFEVMHDWFNEAGFSGCMFINAAAEFAELENPCHQIAAEHKRLILDYISGLAEEAGASEPATLAYELNLLLEGAIVCAYVMGDKSAAQKAKSVADTLVSNALSAHPSR